MAAAETESVVTEDAVPTSYLTGLECTGRVNANSARMAVMLNNIKVKEPCSRNRTGIRDL